MIGAGASHSRLRRLEEFRGDTRAGRRRPRRAAGEEVALKGVSSGASLLMDSVAAALIGYAALDARRPNVLGSVEGAIFVGILRNGLTMLNAPYYTQDFFKGAVLVGVLALIFGLGRKGT